MSLPRCLLLFLLAGVHTAASYSLGRTDESWVGAYLPEHKEYPVKWEHSPQRFPRDVAEEYGLVPNGDKEMEVVTDPATIKSVEEHNLPEGEYVEIPSPANAGGRGKRATVTVIRVRNRRTGRVTYIIIRRR